MSKWFEQKATLAKEGLVRDLFVKIDGISFATTSALNFEPALIETHSQRLGELLDRCLSIRKDIRELEVLEVKAATDYKLFTDTSEIDKKINVLYLQVESKKKEQAGFKNASTAFANAATLEKGLSEIAKGRDAALGEDLRISDEQTIPLIETRWQTLREYQDRYHARYTEPGNAHNYAERATHLLRLLTVLLDEALARAAALAAGIHRIYGVRIPDVPVSVTLQTIDEFAIWALRTIRSLSHAAEQETASEIVIPLVQPGLVKAGPLIEATAFNAAVANAINGPISLSFDLPNNSLLDRRARLRGIGMSFGNNFARVPGSGIDSNQTADIFTRLMVKVTTPPQMGEDGAPYRRPEVLIGNVGLLGASATSLVEGNAIENLSPFGTWNIVIHPFMVWKDGTQRIISDPNVSDTIRDLKLALRFYVPGTYSIIHQALQGRQR